MEIGRLRHAVIVRENFAEKGAEIIRENFAEKHARAKMTEASKACARAMSGCRRFLLAARLPSSRRLSSSMRTLRRRMLMLI